MRNSRSFSLICAALIASACSQAPIRSTVDAYGESPLERSTPLCFVRESRPLGERPVVDSCREAVQALKIPVAAEKSPDCRPVLVVPGLANRTQTVETSPGVRTSVGYFGGGIGLGTGIGIGSGSTRIEDLANRELRITIFQDASQKEAIRSIEVRSAGREASVPAVAFEMCEAAFRDYPKNLRGQTYETPRREAQ